MEIRNALVKLSLLKFSSSKKKLVFRASLSYRRPHFDLVDDVLTVANRNNT